MHPEAQYARLVRRDYGETEGVIAADGWRYNPPDEGRLDPTSLAAAVAILARHTATPGAEIAAIWDGWGGLVSAADIAHFVPEPGGGGQDRHTDEEARPGVGAWLRPRLAAVVRHGIAGARSLVQGLPGRAGNNTAPGTGLLTRQVAIGPRFGLHADTGRSYIPFEAGAQDFADPRWPSRAPWVREVMWAQSPSILWSEDHAWVLATEIDFDSTLVAGTTALVRELVQTPGLEVLPLRPDANLRWGGDLLNRPG